MDYGTNGQVLFDSWKRKYNEIEGHVKFGGADPDEAFLTLKMEINEEINRQYEKRASKKKFGTITAILAPILILMLGAVQDIGAWVTIFAIGLPVYGFTSMKGCDKVILAAIDFDKLYFDGEIFYHRKNG